MIQTENQQSRMHQQHLYTVWSISKAERVVNIEQLYKRMIQYASSEYQGLALKVV